MLFHENRLLADDSSSYLLFLKNKQHYLKVSSAANYRWRFMGQIMRRAPDPYRICRIRMTNHVLLNYVKYEYHFYIF